MVQFGRMLKKGFSANGPRGCGSMRLFGVGYLFTRRLRRGHGVRCLTAPARVMPALPGLVTRPAVSNHDGCNCFTRKALLQLGNY